MDRIAIIANGDFPVSEFPRYLISSADAVVCCDGAIDNYLEFSGGRLPDAIVGDMDSIRDMSHFEGIAVKIEEQDDADIAKAVKYACKRWSGATRVQIFGATGKCEDHTIGNYGQLMQLSKDLPGRNFEIISDYTTALVLTWNDVIDCGEGRTVSIFTPDNSLRLKSTGLQWPLDGVVFDNWWQGVRNRSCADRISIEFSHPSAVLVILN
ncbi:MAG: thiamine diphosphokinase [Candidatus Cryptobacteroides sp.]